MNIKHTSPPQVPPAIVSHNGVVIAALQAGETLSVDSSKKQKQRIYISGKITGLHPDVIRLFAQAEDHLKAMGWEVVNPLAIDHPHDDGTWETYMLTDIKALFTCDAIYMLENWYDSRGARIERAIAHELRKPVIYENALTPTL